MKVKIFHSIDSTNELEEDINKFIEEIRKDHMEVKDIKYSTMFGRAYHYSALVMYGDDGIYRLDMGLWEGVPEIRDGRTNI